MRVLYHYLLWLHPRQFRERFEQEMLCGFDDTAHRASGLWLICDAALSLLRQWVLRPQHWTAGTDTPSSLSEGGPLSAMVEDARPNPAALLCGGVLSLVLFVGIVGVSQLGGVSISPSGLFGAGFRQGESKDTTSNPLPTPAAQRLAEWIDAYNTADIAIIRAFASAHIAKHRDGLDAAERDIQKWRDESGRFGPFGMRILVEHSEPHQIVATAQLNKGERRRIVLEVESNEPHRITNVSIENLAHGQLHRTSDWDSGWNR